MITTQILTPQQREPEGCQFCVPHSAPESLTPQQRAIMKALCDTHTLQYFGDNRWALWRRDIEWSQGRTSENAVKASDMDALKEARFLDDVDRGGLHYREQPLHVPICVCLQELFGDAGPFAADGEDPYMGEALVQ